MGYLSIKNLYKDTDILLFKECYALEKIHGTSAHIRWNKLEGLGFFSGGESYERFVKLFNKEKLEQELNKLCLESIFIYGEFYGGKCQGMSETYGKEMKFVVFDVKIDDNWLNVPNAEEITKKLGLEFVSYSKISTNLEEIDKERDKPSVQAIRNSCGENKLREGIVLRPLIELTKNNGDRIIVKHKGEKFSETKTKREVNPDKLKVLENANEIANEWVTEMRLNHVLDRLGNPTEIEKTGEVIKTMIEDVTREAKDEIVESKEVSHAIGKRTAELYKKRIKI